LVEKYISGPSLADFAKETVNQSDLTEPQYELAQSLGVTLAAIHRTGVSVGDAKPENFVVKDGEIFVVDLEQAGKRGDYAWDIAELLFYTGHYSTTPVPTRALRRVTHAFVRGYLQHGDVASLRKAAGVRYAKVFSIWTSPPAMLEISKTLRDAG
jgi:tRNA A-37 threonylcarbamoyl transferase component Bud32